MKLYRTYFQILLAITAFGATEVVRASFVNYYDVTNWTTTVDPVSSDASIDLSNAPNSITLTSGNNGTGPVGNMSNIDFTIAAEATSRISFDWIYETNDDSAEFDPFFFLLNGTEHAVSFDFGPLNQGGHFEFDVQIGDILGFRQQSFDSLFGSASATVSNFNAAVPVPTPGSFALLAMALAGLNAFRHKRV